MFSLKYLFACIPAILCLIGNIYGGWSASLNIIYSMLLLPVLEWFLPDATDTNDTKEGDVLPTIILILLSALHFSVTFTLLNGVISERLTGIFLVAAVLSSGIHAGTNGIVVAHELIHRKSALLRALGIFNLFQVNYAHFYIEHIKGHHKYVCTEGDPATARYGENLYSFIFRTIPGQFMSAFYSERRRIYHHSGSHFFNFVTLSSLIELLILAVLTIIFGIGVLAVYLAYAAMAIFLLEYVNYIEHYGLSRDLSEKFSTHHAWQSNKITSRYGLVELSRHADHHLRASKPYQVLQHHQGYSLPSGYYGMFYVALMPPLWFKMINPILRPEKFKKIRP
jgi:alkane 1-monooxygenase